MTTDNQEYVFIPAGNEPTVQNLKRGLIKMIGFIAVCSVIVSYFLKRNQEINILFGFIILSILVAVISIIRRYIQNIRIDPNTRKLYATYLKMNGENGTMIFDLDLTRINYKLNFTKTGSYWELILQDGKSKISLKENKSNKEQTNSFPKDQLDRINEVINQIKNNAIDQHS